jgi:hypothetical protein
MTSVTPTLTLIHPEETFTIPVLEVINKCSLFAKNPELLNSPYRVQSSISLSTFREFVSGLEGNSMNITNTNSIGLESLCEEFGFSELSLKLSKFKFRSERSEGSQGQQLGNRIVGIGSAQLRESIEFIVNGRVIERDFAESAALFVSVREQLSVDSCARKIFVTDSRIEAADIVSFELLLSGETLSKVVSEGFLIDFLGNVSLDQFFDNCLKVNLRKNQSELMIETRIDFESADVSVLSVEELDNLLLREFVTVESEDSLLRHILKLGPDYRDLVRHIKIEFLSADGLSLLSEDFRFPSESVWQSAAELISHPPPPPFKSEIISDFPDILAESQGKRFSLLWRGSRDGFKAKEFHRRCNGHANTLTVILDTKGNIFGGFTPVEWESRDWHEKADDSLKSFLFTLKNPHNIPGKKFALNAKMKHKAIKCDFKTGPRFGGGSYCDICVLNNCNVTVHNHTSNFGSSYINDTGLDRKIVLTGAEYFQVKEIEVFEIAD